MTRPSTRLYCSWVARAFSITTLELRCVSQLVASQIRGEYEVKNERMAQYLLIATDYFTKWVEAKPYPQIKAGHLTQFM